MNKKLKCLFIFLILLIFLSCLYLKSSSKRFLLRHENGENDLVIIYNRIPKSGSTSVANIVYKLCPKNKFHSLFINVSRNSHQLTAYTQISLVRNISNWNAVKPAFYHGHFAFVDFSKFGYRSPVYVNFVRDPLERLVSYFYFLRFGDNFRPHLKRSRMNKVDQSETFDQCVQNRGSDCNDKHIWLQIPFFCGQASFCWDVGSPEALVMAKHNVVHRYAFVGITEDLRGGLALLERMYPSMFAGATTLYDGNPGLAHMRKTSHKRPPNTDTIAELANRPAMKMERLFYEFVRAQFHQMAAFAASPRGAQQLFSYRRIRPRLK